MLDFGRIVVNVGGLRSLRSKLLACMPRSLARGSAPHEISGVGRGKCLGVPFADGFAWPAVIVVVRPLSLAQEVGPMRANVAVALAVALLLAWMEQASAQQEGGGQPGRSPSGYDPGQYFERMSGGQEVWVRPQSEGRKQAFFDRVAASLGITNGQITRQQWLDGQARMKKTVSGGKGLAPGKPAPGQAA